MSFFTIRTTIVVALGLALFGCASPEPSPQTSDSTPVRFTVTRIGDAPIITSESHPSIGVNIQGPSLIRVPDWAPNPLGKYYLYFADHKGAYIRLAYADKVTGPWKIHAPGALRIEDTPFPHAPPPFTDQQMAEARARSEAAGTDMSQFPDVVKELTTPHVASPDVHVDHANRRIIMYYHGLEAFASQLTRAATSADGLHFTSSAPTLGRTYWRAFPHEGKTYAIAMPGIFYRSSDPLSSFEQGPTLFNRDMRHAAVFQRGNTLYVVWSQVATDPPERLLMSAIDISGPWESWKETSPVELLRPEREWEGGNLPQAKSARSFAPGPVNQLRDPAIYEEDGRIYLLYAVKGESGIALAELKPLR